MRKLGRYEIIEEIGSGGFGVVYKARDALERIIALKVLQPVLLNDRSAVQRFQREALAAASLRHPNIVFIYDVGEQDGSHFIAMDYLSGQSFDKLISVGKPLPLQQVAPIIEQIASALDFAHANGLVHRDVKTSNIIVSDTGHATLTDFGLVRLSDGNSLSFSGVVGTPDYMSPEQAEPRDGWPQDGRMDVYALGMVAYQALAGKLPFAGSTPLEVMRAHVERAVPPPCELNPDLPRAAEAILLKALAKHPADRYTHAGEFAEGLSAVARQAAEEEEKHKRLEGLYAEGNNHEKSQHWIDAIGAYSQIIGLNPAYRDVTTRLQYCSQELSTRTKWINEVDRLRSTYDQAMAMYGQDRFDAAIQQLQVLLVQLPDYPQANVKLIEIRAARERWLAERQVRLGRLYDEARAAVASAREKALLIIGEMPSYPDPEGILELVRVKPPAPPPPKPPEPKQSDADSVILVYPEPTVAIPSPAPVPNTSHEKKTALASKDLLVLTLDEDVTLELVRVPAGEFLMGGGNNDNYADNYEKPQHRLILDEHLIGRYPVTNRQFRVFISETHYKTTAQEHNSAWVHTKTGGYQKVDGAMWMQPRKEYPVLSECLDYPVQVISWIDALVFCDWLSSKCKHKICLPSEAQWEKAARGTDGRIYPWGNQAPDNERLNFANAVGMTAKVGGYSHSGDSPYGAADMCGNVWEWVSSLYLPYPYVATDGRENAKDPRTRVLRGGGFYTSIAGVRCTSRRREEPDFCGEGIGFRICMLPD